MKKTIVLRDFYHSVLKNFDKDIISTELLMRIVAGSEKADDYEEILRKDPFFTSMVCSKASETMRQSVVKSLGHGVVLVGVQHIRNAVLGHSIKRMFSETADTEFQKIEESEKYTKYAQKAEEHAKKCNNEYSGLAFAAGYILDIINYRVNKDATLAEWFLPFLESTWKHGIKAATIAWAIATHERVFISYRKLLFAGGILHDVGKLALALYDPNSYKICLEEMRANRENYSTDDIYEVEIEGKSFDLTHAEIGSALIFQTPYLRELEMEVDFHHDCLLLKTRNTEAFLGAAVMNIADRMAWLMDRNPNFGHEEIQEILKPHESYFPLKSSDILELFASVRSRGLFNA